jgi:hypothetical protein
VRPPRLAAAPRLVAALLLLLASAGALAAQEGSPQADGEGTTRFGRPRYMIYLFEAEEGTLSAEQAFVLYNSILAAVAEANRDVILMESPDPSVPRTREGKAELARRINADSWLAVRASGGFENLTIEAETFDILRQETIGQQVIRPGFVVDYRTIARGFWDGIVAAIRDQYKRVIDLTTLTIHGRPGTEVLGVPGGPFRIDVSGTLVERVPYPSVFELRARAPGVYEVERPLSLGIDPLEFDLGQVAKPWIGVEANLSSLQFPGLRMWVSVIPAQVFFRLGFSTQLVGIYPIDNSASILAAGSPLSLIQLDAGLYLLPAEQQFRLFVALGGYLRLSTPSGYFGLDTEGAAGAVTLSLGGDYSPSRRLRFVVDYQPAFILAPDPQKFITLSFVANSFPSGQVPGYLMLPWGLFDLRNLYLGVRLDL